MGVETLRPDVTNTDRPPVGIDHTTVVPENFDPETDARPRRGRPARER